MSVKTGFFGLGIMGSRMAMNILRAGFDITVYNRTESKSTDLATAGAGVASSCSQLAGISDIFMTMLSGPGAIEQNALGENGFLTIMKPGSTWLDFSTVNPRFSLRMAHEARERNIRFVDAPVAGTREPAAKGELIVFAGGSATEISDLKPIFDAIGKKTVFLGDTGKGTAAKMIVNLMLSNAMNAFAEALSLGTALGLDQGTMAEILIGGPVTAPFLASKNNKIAMDDYSVDFPLKHMLKDIFLATEEAYYHDLALPQTSAVRELYALAVKQGLGDQDFSAIYKLLAKENKKEDG